MNDLEFLLQASLPPVFGWLVFILRMPESGTFQCQSQGANSGEQVENSAESPSLPNEGSGGSASKCAGTKLGNSPLMVYMFAYFFKLFFELK